MKDLNLGMGLLLLDLDSWGVATVRIYSSTLNMWSIKVYHIQNNVQVIFLNCIENRLILENGQIIMIY
jgi:hypothetical protein